MQDTTEFRTNRDLFSNHYLDEHLPDTDAWKSVDSTELQEAYEDIVDLWERERDLAPDRNESQLEEKFIRPMFRKLGIPFEVEESVEQGQRRPDYGFFQSDEGARDAFKRRREGGDFYRNAVAVADAKRWGRKLDTRGEQQRDFENPSYQIHVYLQETPTTWAVLTNGEYWRLYYGPTSHRLDSYYEIHLPTVLESGNLEVFKYFYLFFRHEAFLPDASGDCFLDDVYSESNVFAEELGEDLQDNIYDAIQSLAEGFLSYPENDLGADDLDLIHDSSLIYLYRLIFVLYAESEGRDLLNTGNEIYEQSYSLNTIKQEVAEELDSDQPSYQSWQSNLWNRFDELFQLIDQGSASRGIPEEDLHVPAYNGGLFRTDPDPDDSPEAQFLATHVVGDEYLARVIELLTRSQTASSGKIFVDYSSLDVRHLGSIYEGLLEYQLNVANEPLTLDDGEYDVADDGGEVIIEPGEVYLTTDSGERKATGSYYTPEYVVEYIVKNTLEPLVNDIREDLAGNVSYDDEHESGFAAEFAERIFDLKVLDPAMGSGHFLTNAIDYLAREIIDAQERQAEQRGVETVNEDHDINWARRQVAQRCIYGVDLNPLAVELAKVSLWLRTLAAEQPLAFLDHHLKTGNSLIGSDIEDVLSNGESETEGGQLTLQQSFARTRQQALEHVMDRFQDLLSIDNESLEDIKEMEAVFEEVRDDPLYQHLLAMANVHTAEEFGLDVPGDAYKRMAEALRDDSWDEIEGQDWFGTAQAMAEDEEFFHWELEFPVAFYNEDGGRRTDHGFDAVIGNPPYIKIQNLPESIRPIYEGRYQTAKERFDIYNMFVEKGYEISSGKLGYILPNKFFESNGGEPLRKYIATENALSKVTDFGKEQVFPGVSTYTCLLFLDNAESVTPSYSLVDDDPSRILEDPDFREVSVSGSERWNFLSQEESAIVNKIENTGSSLQETVDQIFVGIQTSADKVFVLQDCDVDEDVVSGYSRSLDMIVEVEKGICHPYATGDEINRYQTPKTEQYLIYPYNGEGDLLPESTLSSRFPSAFKYLEENRSQLEDRGGENQQFESWYAHWCPRKPFKFERTKVLIPEIVKGGEASLDPSGELYHSTTVYSPILSEDESVTNKEILAILNSSSIWFYIKNTGTVLRGGYYRYKTDYLEPIGVPSEIQGNLEKKVSEVIEYSDRRESLNLTLTDYLGNYEEGPALPDVGLFQPTDSSILDATTDECEKLRVSDVITERDSRRVTVYAAARYKPENEDEYETDQWGYTETDYYEAFALTDLSEEEAALVEAFVPVAVEKADGFASFRDNATKTNSPIDRLKAIILPDPDDVADDLQRYTEVKEQAEELNEKIEKTDRLIDEIVYDLYDLTDEEIEIVESAVQDD